MGQARPGRQPRLGQGHALGTARPGHRYRLRPAAAARRRRLAEAGAKPSIGSVGDSYDNAMAESIIGLFKPN